MAEKFRGRLLVNLSFSRVSVARPDNGSLSTREKFLPSDSRSPPRARDLYDPVRVIISGQRVFFSPFETFLLSPLSCQRDQTLSCERQSDKAGRREVERWKDRENGERKKEGREKTIGNKGERKGERKKREKGERERERQRQRQRPLRGGARERHTDTHTHARVRKRVRECERLATRAGITGFKPL